MFDSKTLHDFLTANVHEELYPLLFVISRKGKLVAHSATDDIAGTKSKAALVAKIWRERALESTPSDSSTSQSSDPPLIKVLTVESHGQNILIRPIQSNMLLVLIGAIPPGTSRGFKVTSETAADEMYPPDDGKLERDVVALTSESPTMHSRLHALMLQRRKLDMLAETIMAEAKVVTVPDD